MKCPMSLVPIVVVIESVVMGIKGRGLFERCGDSCSANVYLVVLTTLAARRFRSTQDVYDDIRGNRIKHCASFQGGIRATCRRVFAWVTKRGRENSGLT